MRKIKFKNNILSQIFLIFEKNRQQSRDFELVSADLEALLLWVAQIKAGIQKNLLPCLSCCHLMLIPS
jgi:hypothetical protein